MAKGAYGIFYLDANKAYLYSGVTGATLQVDIPVDTISYFDILNKEKFSQIIQALVTTNKLEAMSVVMLVAPASTYGMDITSKIQEEINTQTQQFIDSVPFEKVLSKTYKTTEGTKVFATNRDLYEAVKHAFEKVKFSVSGIVSLAVLQKMMPELGTSLNLEMMASKIDAIRQYSFITFDEMNNVVKPDQQEDDKEKPNPLRLYGLIGAFVVLIGILVVTIIVTMQPTNPPVTVKNIPSKILTPTPIPSIVPLISPKPSLSVTIAPSVIPTNAPTKPL